jgi:hypothetical protein
VITSNWKNFTGKEVIVYASGVTYRGKLIEMNESSILLRASTGHREIPLEGVSRMELAEDAGGTGGGIRSPSPLSGFSSK